MRFLIFKSKPILPLLTRAIRWHLSFYLTGSTQPISAGIYITNLCNLKCSMCPYGRPVKAETVPVETFKNYIDALARCHCYYFSISGGEPLLVDDIAERVAYASERIPYTHLVTNGWLVTPELARALNRAGLNELSISIDGSEAHHDRIRGKKGSWQKAWQSLEIMRNFAPSIIVSVNSIVGPENVEDIRELVLRLERQKIACKVAPFCHTA